MSKGCGLLGTEEGRHGRVVDTVVEFYEWAKMAVKTADGITDWFKVFTGQCKDQCLAHCFLLQ